MKAIQTAIFLLVLSAPVFVAASTPLTLIWNNFDDPLGITFPSGISGNKVVGVYQTTQNSEQIDHGFLFDGMTFHALDNPSAVSTGLNRSPANGIDGNNIVGSYGDGFATHGFLYDGTNWKQLDDPLATDGTFANGISGNQIVGYYRLLNNGNNFAFVYDGTSYVTLRNPSFPSYGTTATAISGTKIVGFYNSPTGAPPGLPGSFLFDGTTWIGLGDPQALNDNTYVQGIDGNNIVGYYYNATGTHGFLYDGTIWTTLDDPLAQQKAPFGTFVTGISGNNIVGWYEDASNTFHGFIATIVPEPSTFALAFVGTLLGIAAGAFNAARRGPNGQCTDRTLRSD